MAVEDRRIPTRTIVTSDESTISIFVEYFPEGSVDLRFFVSVFDQTVESASFIGGDLGYSYTNVSDLFEINNAGDLIVNSVTPTRYSINAEGDLIYTT